MTRARSISLVLAIALIPAFSSCASRSIPPVAQTGAAMRNAAATPLRKATLTGSWKGSWHSGSGYSGGFTMKVTQKGKKFSGPVSITVGSQVVKATIKGTLQKKGKIALTVSVTKLGTGKGTAQTNKMRTSMNGSLTFSKFGAIKFSASKG
jgi:hypothetical protein